MCQSIAEGGRRCEFSDSKRCLHNANRRKNNARRKAVSRFFKKAGLENTSKEIAKISPVYAPYVVNQLGIHDIVFPEIGQDNDLNHDTRSNFKKKWDEKYKSSILSSLEADGIITNSFQEDWESKESHLARANIFARMVNENNEIYGTTDYRIQEIDESEYYSSHINPEDNDSREQSQELEYVRPLLKEYYILNEETKHEFSESDGFNDTWSGDNKDYHDRFSSLIMGIMSHAMTDYDDDPEEDKYWNWIVRETLGELSKQEKAFLDNTSKESFFRLLGLVKNDKLLHRESWFFKERTRQEIEHYWNELRQRSFAKKIFGEDEYPHSLRVKNLQTAYTGYLTKLAMAKIHEDRDPSRFIDHDYDEYVYDTSKIMGMNALTTTYPREEIESIDRNYVTTESISEEWDKKYRDKHGDSIFYNKDHLNKTSQENENKAKKSEQYDFHSLMERIKKTNNDDDFFTQEHMVQEYEKALIEYSGSGYSAINSISMQTYSDSIKDHYQNADALYPAAYLSQLSKIMVESSAQKTPEEKEKDTITVHRGMRDAFNLTKQLGIDGSFDYDSIKPGYTFETGRITSTSLDPHITDQFDGDPTSNARIFMSVETHTWLNVSDISDYPDEKEIIIPEGVPLVLTRKETKGNQIRLFFTEESIYNTKKEKSEL